VTATHVNGLAVIADEPALSPITTGAGAPIYFQQIRQLLLEDDSTAYGCVHCDFAAGSINAVRPHLRKHREQPSPKTRQPKLSELTLGELLKRLDEHTRVAADRDSWKARALKAERNLGILRKTLRSDG
jgi:hypothetical protein